MDEKRRVERLKKDNQVTITIVSDGETNSKGKVVLGQSKDVSVLGTKIQVNYYLPVDSLLKIVPVSDGGILDLSPVVVDGVD